MEPDASNEIGEWSTAAVTVQSEPAALDLIRTETVLSKLPVHNLAKKGKVEIRIIKTDLASGKIELLWDVSPNPKFGDPRALAYKLDTIVINSKIDEQGRPLPKMICLGSLRDVADDLDLGGDTNKVKKALRQNASLFITAKLTYQANDGSSKRIEADFTRYSVIFTGEQLPDGRKADAVYIIFNDPYWEVLNNAPIRPLNRSYMKELPPAAQRFYEIISYKIFSALKYHHPFAKISYSEYCTFSAQQRSYNWEFVRPQMYQVHQPHLRSGYISKVQYEEATDGEGKRDWLMCYIPGPKARAEFAAAHRGRKTAGVIDVQPVEAGETKSRRPYAPRQRRLKLEAPRETIQVTMPNVTKQPAPEIAVDPEILSALTARGITETTARELIANLKPDQNVFDQLEWGEHQTGSNPGKFTNPAGFLIHLIRENVTVPATFETSRQRKIREEIERRRLIRQQEIERLENEYRTYKESEIDRYIQDHLDPTEFLSIKTAHARRIREQYRNLAPSTIESMAGYDAKREIGESASVLSFEEFAHAEKAIANANLSDLPPHHDPVTEQQGSRNEPEVGKADAVITTEAKQPESTPPAEASVPQQPAEPASGMPGPLLSTQPDPLPDELPINHSVESHLL